MFFLQPYQRFIDDQTAWQLSSFNFRILFVIEPAKRFQLFRLARFFQFLHFMVQGSQFICLCAVFICNQFQYARNVFIFDAYGKSNVNRFRCAACFNTGGYISKLLRKQTQMYYEKIKIY